MEYVQTKKIYVTNSEKIEAERIIKQFITGEKVSRSELRRLLSTFRRANKLCTMEAMINYLKHQRAKNSTIVGAGEIQANGETIGYTNAEVTIHRT